MILFRAYTLPLYSASASKLVFFLGSPLLRVRVKQIDPNAMLLFAQGHRIKVLDRGTGPAVLLLHGFPDDAELWNHQVPALLAAGFRVIAPDLLGYGGSDKPSDPAAYTLDAVSKGLVSLLDQLHVQHVSVVGHDWGAAVAWRLAYSIPHRVQRLVVLSVGHPGGGCAAGGTRQRQLWWYMLLFQHPRAGQLLAAGDWALLRDMLPTESWEVQQRYIAALSQQDAMEGALNWYRANMPPEVFAQTKLRDNPPVACPVLGIWGTKDTALTEEQMVASKRYVQPGKWRYERWQDAGHWLMRDRPQQLATALVAFLSQQDQLAGSGTPNSSL